MATGTIFVLSAPSGAGKSTVLKSVLRHVAGLSFSISHTTRTPRKGETDGIEYHFVSHQTFLQMIENGDFLEYAEVHGNYYGTSRTAVIDQVGSGVDVILDIDVQGARIVRNSGLLDGIYIFLAPPSIQELKKRLETRGLDSRETIDLRLANAKKEMDAMGEYEYLIINDRLEDAILMFEAVILAERARSRRDSSGKYVKVECH
jgi:guanylate kinase